MRILVQHEQQQQKKHKTINKQKKTHTHKNPHYGFVIRRKSFSVIRKFNIPAEISKKKIIYQEKYTY